MFGKVKVFYLKNLLIGFEGNANSAKLLLDEVSSSFNKIYLLNDKSKSVKQVVDVLERENIGFILAIGQKPVIKDKICLELQGVHNDIIYSTKYPVEDILNFFNGKYDMKLSKNAGTSFCNNLYFNILKYIEENNLKTKILFIHIPMLKNISDFYSFSKIIEGYLNNSLIFY